MQIMLTHDVIMATKCGFLRPYRDSHYAHSRVDQIIEFKNLDDEILADLANAAESTKDTKLLKTIQAISAALQDDFSVSIPAFNAFAATLKMYIRKYADRGWVYITGRDGFLYPYAAVNMHYITQRNGQKDIQVELFLQANLIAEEPRFKDGGSLNLESVKITFRPGDVIRKKMSDILKQKGLIVASKELNKQFDEQHEYFMAVISQAYAGQFRINGAAFKYDRYRKDIEVPLDGVKAICDSRPPIAMKDVTEVDWQEESIHIPVHPLLRMFRLDTHEYCWVNVGAADPYQYDKSLADKIILPQSHRDLLDILTKDIDVFTSDFIEGKSAGNVIMCKGPAGVGKTLTAEVYSELIEKPLYKVHTGSLGTTPENINKNLEVIFQRSAAWGCVLLLDEADVFVSKRGQSIVQNAIVAEFLRTLEYFSGLMFMTTNRPDDIDDAILSRCAAVISYDVPSEADQHRVWKVMAEQFEYPLPEELRNQLVAAFPKIQPRDLKHLLRLALRVSRARNKDLDFETIRQCAMFRPIDQPVSLPA